MRSYSQEDYYHAVSELVDAIAEKYGNSVKAIYSGGSFARGDFVPGRSDVDIYIVAKDRKEELQRDLQSEASEIERKYFRELKSVIDEVLGVTVTTQKEIEEGRSFLGAGFEYSNFIKEGRLLWGEDIKTLIPIPSQEKQKESAEAYLEQVYEMVSNQEKRFRLLKWIPLKFMPRKNKERWTRGAFNLTFRTAALFLVSKGICVNKKEAIVHAFNQHIKEQELCGIISLALSLWEKWKTQPLNNKETKLLLQNSLEFVRRLQQQP